MNTQLDLPQHAHNKAERNSELERMREAYAYTFTYDGKIATVDQLPSWEKGGWYYKYQLYSNALKLLPSLPSLAFKFFLHKITGKPFKQPKDLIFFPLSPFPDRKFRRDFWDDWYIGQQLVAGPNPFMLKCVDKFHPLPNTFKVKEAKLMLNPNQFNDALKGRHLFMVNYEELIPLTQNPGKTDHGDNKYLTAPIGLFNLDETTGDLMPLAIQLDGSQATGIDNPIITPTDKKLWKLARTCLMAADATMHDLATHAVGIHYVMEAIIMASYRQLGRQHPLLTLLDAHFQYTLNINVKPLYEPADGKIPKYSKMFASTNSALVDFMGNHMRAYSFRENAFPYDIKNRGVDNPALNYPYRDDGKPLWDAVQRFATDYVQSYYHTNLDVVNDYELQSWANELGGKTDDNKIVLLKDFPTSFSTREEVAETIGHIIFMATAKHSSIHYPQTLYTQFVPNQPSSLLENPFEHLQKGVNDSELMNFMPRLGMSVFQSFIYFFVNFKASRMGEYCLATFDQRAEAPIGKFQRELKEIAEQQRTRDQGRRMRYPYMNPANIPNSVSA